MMCLIQHKRHEKKILKLRAENICFSKSQSIEDNNICGIVLAILILGKMYVFTEYSHMYSHYTQ